LCEPAIRQLQEMEERHNYNRKQHYLRAVADWKRNFFEKGARLPIPQPPLAVHYRYQDHDAPVVIEGPDYVAEAFTPPEPPIPAEGVVAFGPPSEDGTGSYLVDPSNTVAPGTLASRDGIEYVFVQLGRIGTLSFRKLWIPTGN
jgi:hypothetical protein